MIPGAVEEDLGLVFQTAEGAGVNDPIAVPLKLGSPSGRFLAMDPTASGAAELGEWGKEAAFPFLEIGSTDR